MAAISEKKKGEYTRVAELALNEAAQIYAENLRTHLYGLETMIKHIRSRKKLLKAEGLKHEWTP